MSDRITIPLIHHSERHGHESRRSQQSYGRFFDCAGANVAASTCGADSSAGAFAGARNGAQWRTQRCQADQRIWGCGNGCASAARRHALIVNWLIFQPQKMPRAAARGVKHAKHAAETSIKRRVISGGLALLAVEFAEYVRAKQTQKHQPCCWDVVFRSPLGNRRHRNLAYARCFCCSTKGINDLVCVHVAHLRRT